LFAIERHGRPPPLRSKHPPDGCNSWAFFLDVDGTLIEIAETPDAVLLDMRLLGLVECLFRASGGATAMVSGRSIADLDRRLGRPDIPIAGQHGLERRDATGNTILLAEPSGALSTVSMGLRELAERHSDLLFEDKGLTLSLHYRRAPALGGYLYRRVRQLVASTSGLLVQHGKCVIEIKPSGFDKGSAISAYLAEPPFRDRIPVFIGDDVTDENGFNTVNAFLGISIKVGRGRTCARYRLPDVTAVRAWLARAAQVTCT